MNYNQQPNSFGELVYDEEHRLSVIDLISAVTYLISSNLISSDLVQGLIVEFILKENIPAQLIPLAQPDSVRAKLYKIAANKQLTPFFPQSVQTEVAAIANQSGIDDPSLINLENLPFCTIDGADTLDLDQALHVEKTAGGYTIRYAIADAAYYIKPGSALFDEALKRGASFYLPGLMIPMLPRELCIDVISLNEHVCRRAVIFEIGLDNKGCHQQTKIVRARIKSRGKLSFQEVEIFLANPEVSIRNDRQLSESLVYFKEIGLLRLKLAEERNVVRYHRTEINVKTKADGLTFKLLDNIRNEVELYNEQLSLLCNITGAKQLKGVDDQLAAFIQPIYKIHPPPSNEKVDEFEATIKRLIKIHSLDAKQWQWQRNDEQALSEYLKNLPQKGREQRIAKTIHRQALLTNTRSSFSEQPGRHHGVGAEVYARFSSPMREIVGIFLHKELMEKISGNYSAEIENEDDALREQVIQVANRAKDVQRQLINESNLLVLDQVFSVDFALPLSKRPLRKGTVIGLGRDKIYILLDENAIEIKLYLSSLEVLWKTPIIIDKEQLSLVRKTDQQTILSLGDEVDVVVSDKNEIKHRWIFSIKLN